MNLLIEEKEMITTMDTGMAIVMTTTITMKTMNTTNTVENMGVIQEEEAVAMAEGMVEVIINFLLPNFL
jgi:hypothetical protein